MRIKRFLSLLLAAALLLGAVPLSAGAEPAVTFQTVDVQGGVSILAVNYGETVPEEGSVSLEIPSDIGGKAVVRIEYEAFSGDRAIRSVVIPASVTAIGYGAFSGCTSLASVTLAGTPAFESATDAFFGRSPTGTFAGCAALSAIQLPVGTTAFSKAMFAQCDQLTAVNLSALTQLTAIPDYAFSGTALTAAELPGAVTAVGDYAFSDNPGLASVTLGSGVTAIGEGAFVRTGLSAVTLPAGLCSLGTDAFADCTALTGVDWSGNNTLQTVTGFGGCTSLPNVFLTTLPASVTAIGTDAFMGCSFTAIALPNGVETIGQQAFADCRQATSLTLPETLTAIGRSAFAGCDRLTEVQVPEAVETIERDAFATGVESHLTLTVLNRDVTLASPTDFLWGILGNANDLPGKTVLKGYAARTDGSPSDVKVYADTMAASQEARKVEFVPLEDEPAAVDYTVRGTVSPADAAITVKAGDATLAPEITRSEGAFSFTVSNAKDVTVTFSKEGFTSQSFTRVAGSTGEWVIGKSGDTVSTIALEELPVNRTLTLTVKDSAGRMYSSLDGMSLNVKKGDSSLTLDTDYKVQYPYIILDNNYSIGQEEELKVTVTPGESLQCSAATATATLAKPSVSVTLPVWGYAEITASSSYTGGQNVLFFDSAGNLAEYDTIETPEANKSYTHTSGRLKAGVYTAVAFNLNGYVSVFQTLAALTASGLTEDTDYKKVTFTVHDTQAIKVFLTGIPTLDTKKFSSIVDTDYSCTRLDEDEPLSGVKFRARVYYGFANANVTSGTLALTIPSDATVNAVYSETAKLTAPTVDSANHVLTLPVSKNRGVFLVDLTVTGAGNRYLSATLSNGSASSPLGSVAFDVYGARLNLPSDSFEKKSTPIVVGLRAAPGTNVTVSVNGTALPAVTANKLGEAKVSFTPSEIDTFKDLTAGEKIVITAGGNSGVMTYYPTDTSVKEFFFTQYRSKYYIVKNYVLEPDVYYNYMYEDPDNDEYKYWSFSATLNTGYAIDENSVFVTVTMKDGTTRNVNLYKSSGPTDAGSDTTDYVFGGSMMIEQPDSHTFLNSRVPVKMELNFDTDYGDRKLKDLPENTSTQSLWTKLKAEMDSVAENTDLSWDGDDFTVAEYRDDMEKLFIWYYLYSEMNIADPDNATEEQKNTAKGAVSRDLNKFMDPLLEDTSAEPDYFNIDWDVTPADLSDVLDGSGFDEEYRQDILNLISAEQTVLDDLRDVSEQLAAGILLDKNLPGYGNADDLQGDLGVTLTEAGKEKVKNNDGSPVTVEVEPASDIYTLKDDQGNTLMTLNTEVIYGDLLANDRKISQGSLEQTRPGSTPSSASGFDIMDATNRALSGLVAWGSGFWATTVKETIKVSMPAVRFVAADMVRYYRKYLKAAQKILDTRLLPDGSKMKYGDFCKACEQVDLMNRNIARTRNTVKWLDRTAKGLDVMSTIGTYSSLGNAGIDVYTLANEINFWHDEKQRYEKLAEYWKNKALGNCETFPTRASCVAACTTAALRAQELKNLHMQYIKFCGTDVALAIAGLCPVSTPVTLTLAAGGCLYSMCADDAKSQLQAEITEKELEFKKAVKEVRRYCHLDIDPCPPGAGNGSSSGSGGSNGGSGGSGGTGGSAGGVTGRLTPGLDPSGIVYEAVLSNVLSGVRATLSEADNTSGNNSKTWPANHYGGQVNPQTTKEDGAFAWYVPDGYYQVKLEKDGYTPQSTDWLEVPPPRLGVNVGLVASADPTVESVKAYPDYIEVTFSQYMSTAKQDTPVVAGYTAKWVSPETDPNDQEKSYSKVLKLMPTGGTVGEVGSTVSALTLSGARNYAGNPSGGLTTTTGDLTVTHRPAKLVVNYTGTISVQIGETPTPRITVQVLDEHGDPLTDQTVKATTVAGQQVAEVTKVNGSIQNMTTFEAKGLFPGITSVTFSVDGSSLKSTYPLLVTNEANRPARPTAQVGGTTYTDTANITVTSGQPLTLHCATTDAVIFYTTDGTCPCQNTASRKKYTAPIPLTENTNFRIAAYQEGKDYSERLNINVTVSGGTGPVITPSSSQYTLTFETNGGSAMDEVTAAAGTEIDLNKYTTTRTNYEFAGWYSDAALTTEVTKITLTDDASVYAKWNRKFTDVAESSWYNDAVYYCTGKGYFYGVSDTGFAPNSTMTRAMFVTVLHRIADGPEVSGSNPFTDVEADKWYTDAVIWAAGESIIAGYGNGIFGTNDPVTREQMVTIFWRYNGSPTVENADLSRFTDADKISGWAQQAMEWAVSVGIISGKGNGILDPKGTATRAEVAKIVMNYDMKVK